MYLLAMHVSSFNEKSIQILSPFFLSLPVFKIGFFGPGVAQ